MSDVATLFIKVDSKQVAVGAVDLEKLKKAAGDAGVATDKLKKKTGDLGKQTSLSAAEMSSSFKVVGRDLSRYVTLPFIAASAASLKFSKDLTTGMGDVQTLIARTGNRIYELQDIVTGMSTETGAGFEDLTRGMYETISAFQDGADTAGRFEAAVKASVAGNASVLDSVRLISAVTKAYGDTSEEAAKKVTDLAFSAVKYGQTTFSELANAITSVTANSDRLAVSQEELFSIYATLTGVTGNAAEVTTQFNRALLSLANPTEELQKLFSKYRTEQGEVVKTGEEFIKSTGGAVNALLAINEEAKASGETLQAYISRATGVTATVALTGKQLETFATKFQAVSNSAGAADDAFYEATNGINRLQVELKKAGQQFAVAGTKIGTVLLPQLVALVQGAADIAEKFANADEGVQKMIIRVVALAAAMGPLLIAFSSFLRLLKLVSEVQLLASAGSGILALLANPAVLIAAGVALVAIGAAIGVIAYKTKEAAEYAKQLADGTSEIRKLRADYSGLEKDLTRAGNSAVSYNATMTIFLRENPEVRKELGLLEASYDNVGAAIERVSKTEFFKDASKDIVNVKKAAAALGEIDYDLENVFSRLLSTRNAELDTGLSADTIGRQVNNILRDLKTGILNGTYTDSIDFNEIIKEQTGLGTIGTGRTGKSLSLSLQRYLNEYLDTYSEYTDELANIQEIAASYGFDASVFLEDGGNPRDWKDYGVLLATLLEEGWESTDIEGALGGAGALDDAGAAKRLKTWSDYFAEITGIAGEAFAHFEKDSEGNTVGFFQGSGKLAADAYKKAFQDELDLTQLVGTSLGVSFSSAGMASALETQIETATGHIEELLSTKVSELNQEGMEFSVADLLTGDQASVERMIEVFGTTDNVIQDMIANVLEMKKAFNKANLSSMIEDFNKQAQGIDAGNGMEGIFATTDNEKFTSQFDLAQEKVSSLRGELERLKAQTVNINGIEMPLDAAAITNASAALYDANEELDKTADHYNIVSEAMNQYGSVGETVAEGMYQGFRTMGYGAEEASALTTVFTGTLDAMVSSLSDVAYAFGEALAGADSFEQAMGDIALTIANTLSSLALAAGLQVIIASAGTNPLGYALVAMGLAGQVMSGYVSATAENNADGGVYEGNVKTYAKGGALADFSNSIVRTPTMFANGSALMGEAGAEAIFPLTRASNGELGVNATGTGSSSGVTVNIINNSNTEAEVTETTDSEGNTSIDVVIGKAVSSAIAAGKADGSMKSRYGLSVQGLN